MSETTRKEKTFAQNIAVVSLGAAFCCFLWGSATPSIKIGYRLFAIQSADTASIILFAGIRFFFAGILTVLAGSLFQSHDKKHRILFPRDFGAIKKVLALASVQTVLQYFFYYGGLAHAAGVNAGIVLSTNVFASLLISVFAFHQEKLTFLKIAGCALGFAGVIFFSLAGAGTTETSFSLNGEGFVFLSCICYGLSSCMIKQFSATEDPVMLSGWQFIAGGAFMSAVGFASGGRVSGFTAKSTLLLFYLCFISSAAYTLWGLLLKFNPVSRVVIFGFLNPLFSVILSAIFLKEKTQTGFVIAAALILVCFGIILVNLNPSRKSKANRFTE